MTLGIQQQQKKLKKTDFDLWFSTLKEAKIQNFLLKNLLKRLKIKDSEVRNEDPEIAIEVIVM